MYNPTPPTYDGNYTGKGIYDGPGWYGKSDAGPIIHCFSRERDKPDGQYGGNTYWFDSRAEAEAYINKLLTGKGGGKRKYSLRRRRGRKHKSRRGGKK